ncbi:hypothetical protein QTO34_004910 [Cnephaeus nilssonii]|uniref:Uncharacterized protein n=1 Tax=Cnephaeus nilssonii TaxID=3371016 RepID=A0AA40HNA3_CNENI|nr:hypothetical protein QTO34_004910 [Eptesicus nilssonii]
MEGCTNWTVVWTRSSNDVGKRLCFISRRSSAANLGARASPQWTQRSSLSHHSKDWMTAKRKRKMTKATQGTEVPTWGQLKKLTTEAQQMAEKQEATPSTMFLAMPALVSCQSLQSLAQPSPRTQTPLRLAEPLVVLARHKPWEQVLGPEQEREP